VKKIRIPCFTSIIFLLVFHSVHAQQPVDCSGHSRHQEIFLWPGTAPGSENVTLEETVIDRSNDPKVSDRIVRGIKDPSLVVFLPDDPAGKAVLICPGGGYDYLSYDKEGVDIACWFNSLGYTAFILKYRLPAEGHANGRDVPLQDAQRAIRTIRSFAEDLNIDKNNIGVIGFSAGGHLASMLGTCFDKNVYTPQDTIDTVDARPDFLILLYPVISMDSSITHTGSRDRLIGNSPGADIVQEYSSNLQISASTPPTFIVLASDDTSVVPENSLRFYRALLEAGVPAELHIFRNGGHGFCIRNAKGSVSNWTTLCEIWLSENGF
jgi:acetyl esterase/lipase